LFAAVYMFESLINGDIELIDPSRFDYTVDDAQAMPVAMLEPSEFDIARYEDYAAACDRRYADFLCKKEGIMVWQRIRVAPVFRDVCHDMRQSLRWQLGGLQKSLLYKSDAPTYLEPWYGIGTIASVYGAGYKWPEGQAPVPQPLYKTIDEVPRLMPQPFDQIPILCHTIRMIEYFLNETHGRLPMSWCDVQAPINIAGELIETSSYFMAFHEAPERLREILDEVANSVIAFTHKQSELIGNQLVQPGHGFASSYAGSGIGMSTDNLVMISPRMYEQVCVASHAKIGEPFGGAVIHSCGDWSKWIDAVKKIHNLRMVDGAFSPQTDPAHNNCERFRDAFAHTGIILHARLVGPPEEVLSRVKRLRKPGVKLVVVTYEQDPKAQHKVYEEIHAMCA
jgi:uroporphyrinogen-III decarboxylase